MVSMRFYSSMVANTRYDPIYTTERREELLVPLLFGQDTAFFHCVYTEAKGNGTKFDPVYTKAKRTELSCEACAVARQCGNDV